jgi:photosystem II stability/assembly factor-like uncharacterized protein
MLNKVSLLGLVLIFAFAQASWLQQHSGTNPLYSITFPFGHVDTGFACGANSLVLRTTDSGENWEVLTVHQPSGACNGINFPIGCLTGFIACDSGNIQRTTDGRTWRRVNTGTTNNLKAIHFPRDNNIGYVISNNGIIKKTTNSGVDWQDVSLPTPANLNGLFFLNATKGWVVGDEGVIYSTFDGGTNWGMQLSPVTERLFDVFFRDSLVGWIVGANQTCLRTIDGGQNWTEVTLPFIGNPDLHSILFIFNTTTGFIAGSNGKFAKTTNNGTTWDTMTIPNASNLYDMTFPLDDQIGWVCGDNEAIFKTTDGGISWLEESKTQIKKTEKFFNCEPNPFRTNTKIQFNGRYENGTLKIFNCAGELVRNFALTGDGMINWDGRDAYHRRVMPGVYLLELKTKEGKTERTKITLLN